MSDDHVAIRPMLEEELPALIDLWQKADLDMRPQGRDTLPALRDQFKQMGRHWLVACEGDRLIGSVMGTHDSRKGWINRLAVHPEWRRRGIAVRLVRAVEQTLAEDGIEIFTALIEDGNNPSMCLLEKSGYERYAVTYFRKKLRDSI